MDTPLPCFFKRMTRFDIITLFPGIVETFFSETILKKAQEKELIEIVVHDLRKHTADKHKTADDYPYGGGAGMILKPEPIVKAIESVRQNTETGRVILTTPQGRRLDQGDVERFSGFKQLIIVCGRYEGVDERVLNFVDEEVSLGDFILSGGEIAACAICDAVARLVPGVVGDQASVSEDTFSNFLLKYPQYTRPADFRGLTVPEILLSGDHEKIKQWRRRLCLEKTLERRPDLLEKARLTDEDAEHIEQIKKETDWSFKDECN